MASPFYILSVFLHLVAAIVWLGGMLFLVLVIIPVLKDGELRNLRPVLVRAVGIRFRWIGWICLALLVVTGMANLHFRGVLVLVGEPAFWSGPFGRILAIKLIVVTALLVMSGVHDFWLGPRASRVAREDPGGPESERMRRIASWMGRVATLLALAAVILGVMLVRGRPW